MLSGADILTADVLPDSRATYIATPKDARVIAGAYWVPIFCASCSTQGGRVPEENCHFAFWLCNDCFVRYGHLTTMAVMPDEVFWERVKQEQLAEVGRVLSEQELAQVVASDSTPLATLILEGRQL